MTLWSSRIWNINIMREAALLTMYRCSAKFADSLQSHLVTPTRLASHIKEHCFCVEGVTLNVSNNLKRGRRNSADLVSRSVGASLVSLLRQIRPHASNPPHDQRSLPEIHRQRFDPISKSRTTCYCWGVFSLGSTSRGSERSHNTTCAEPASGLCGYGAGLRGPECLVVRPGRQQTSNKQRRRHWQVTRS